MAKWYQRHLGDYLSATRHLSIPEHGAYTLLLDYYYATERPIPDDVAKIARIFGLKKDSERLLFQRVLTEFFTSTPEGWRNKKADSELAKMHKISERRSRAGYAGAMTTNRNRSANAEQLPDGGNGEDHAASVRQMPDGEVGNCSANGSANGSANRAVTIASASAIEKKDQELLSSEKPLDPTPPVDKSVDDGGKSTVKARRAAAREIGTRVLEHLNARCGTKFATTGKPADAHMQHIVARIIDDGATEKLLIDVVNTKAFEWGTDEKMRKYLRPATLFNRENFANYVGVLQVEALKPVEPPKPKAVLVKRIDGESKERVVTEYTVTHMLTTDNFPWLDAARNALRQFRKFIERDDNRTVIIEFDGDRRMFKFEELQ